MRARGTFTGNRGILHDAQGRLTQRRWTHKAWICCVLEWQGRKRQVMSGRNWTELFFLDAAVAMAAGHRPCGYCRRADYTDFRDAWAKVTGTVPKAVAMDRVLHEQRLAPRSSDSLGGLPDGTFVVWQDRPALIHEAQLHPYAPDGYGTPIALPAAASATVLTVPAMRAVLAAGYRPALHPTALTSA